ncbi:hypothetical protein EAF04_007339 [Stromatinia cepivora]|nr:hypothetical protein EAF04_007339 [Stromatinia cepivora]
MDKISAVAAREDYFRVGSPRETSLRFEWKFPSSEYEGFPSETEDINEVCPLPQKIVLKWTFEDIDEYNKAIDEGFVKITAFRRTHTWSKVEIHKYSRYRVYDFIELMVLESSLGRPLIPRAAWHSPISNDDQVNFYRWESSEKYPHFLHESFSLWPPAGYFKLNEALDAGYLTIVPINEDEASGSRVSPKTGGSISTQVHHKKHKRQSDQNAIHHPHSMPKEINRTPTNVSIVESSRNDVFYWNTDSSDLSSVQLSSPENTSQVSISENVPHSKIHSDVADVEISSSPRLSFREGNTQIPTSKNVHHSKTHSEGIVGEASQEINNSDLKNLCNQAWTSLENEHKTDGCKESYTRATLNMGLIYAIQLKEQVQRANTLEHENDNLMIQILHLERNQAILQQQNLNIREKDEKEISNARLKGEKIAEKNIERLWNSAKERGGVIGGVGYGKKV